MDEEKIVEAVDEIVNEVVDEEASTVTIEGEEPSDDPSDEPAPDWVRDLRRSNRADKRRIRELEEKLNGQSEPNKPELGKKPRLEDFDYDTDKFEVELESWSERKRAKDQTNAAVETEKQTQQQGWKTKLDDYGKAKDELSVKDFDDVEATVQDSLSVIQQGIILQGSENAAVVIYALGKNSAKLKELAAMTDPVKFAFAVAKLETKMKITKGGSAPAPERKISGGTRSTSAVDSKLEQLRKEAERTGDYTKVSQYKSNRK